MAASGALRATPPARENQLVAGESRLTRATLVTLVLAALYVALGASAVVHILSLPTDGWIVSQDATADELSVVFESRYLDTLSPLQPGDRLVSVEGQTVEQLVRGFVTLAPQRPSSWEAGRSVTYVVLRGGRQLALNVDLVSWTPGAVLGLLGTAPLVWLWGLAQALFTIYVLCRAPGNRAAQVLFLGGLNQAVALIAYPSSVGYAGAPFMLDGAASAFTHGLWAICFTLLTGFWPYVFLVFPTLREPAKSHPWLTIAVLFGAVPVANATVLAVSAAQPLAYLRRQTLVDGIIVAAMMLLALFLALHSLRTIRDPISRAQLRWVVFTLVVIDGAGALLGYVNELALGSWLLSGIVSLLGVGFMAGLAIGILRYRLFEIDVVINRTLVYGSLTVVLGAIYLGGVIVGQMITQAVTGQSGELAIVISTLVIVALFSPLRRRTQALVDRYFYRSKYDAAQTLASLSVSLRDVVDLNMLADRLTSVVKDAMQPASACLALVENGDYDVSRGNADARWLTISSADPLVARCLHDPSPLGMRDIVVDSPTVAALKAASTDLVVPLVSHGEMMGLLCLGPRLSGQDYSTDDRRLLNVLASQAAPAVRVASLVREHQLERESRARMEEELRLAHQIQSALLPKRLPVLDGWGITAHYQPASAVGGDFYDFLELSDGRLAVVIGDVTGKGMPAALGMATTQTALRVSAAHSASPSQILTHANQEVARSLPQGVYVTCFCAALDPTSGQLEYVCAGHNWPLFRSGQSIAELATEELPLGAETAAAYPANVTTLSPGDELLLYSDGVVDARGPGQELFGFDRLRSVVEAHADEEDLGEAILEAVRSFTAGVAEQEDDVTLVVVRRLQGSA